MDNNQGKKPLRQAANAAKDIYNTYVKNSDRNIPIDSDEDKIDDLDEKISAAFADDFVDNEETDTLYNTNNEAKFEEFNSSNNNEEIERLNTEIAFLKDSLARKTAEMENMRRRMDKEKSDLINYANEKLINNLLEIPDTIAQALSSANSTNDLESLKKSIELIYQKTMKLFENAGVKLMEDPTGKEFDVDFHDALMQAPSDIVPEGHIIQVLQDGYLLKDKVIRHAKVITSAGN